MGDPTPEQLQRAVAALYPFVIAYGLPMNPEDVDEAAFAVLRNAFSEASLEEIGRWVEAQIQQHLSAVLDGRIEPGRVFDRTVALDGVPDGYRTMASREALEVLVRP